MQSPKRRHRTDTHIKAPPLSARLLGNEAGFWRKVIRGDRRLTATQKIGILLMYLALIGVLWSALYWENYVYPLKGTPLIAWILDRFGAGIILLGSFIPLLALLFWRARCALRRAQEERLLRRKQNLPGIRFY